MTLPSRRKIMATFSTEIFRIINHFFTSRAISKRNLHLASALRAELLAVIAAASALDASRRYFLALNDCLVTALA